jgi:hypothetical protein
MIRCHPLQALLLVLGNGGPPPLFASAVRRVLDQGRDLCKGSGPIASLRYWRREPSTYDPHQSKDKYLATKSLNS